MDPMEGRIVLHGHISEAGPLASGPIAAEVVSSTIHAALADLLGELRAGEIIHHGPLTLRIRIGAAGRIEAVQALLDRVARSDGKPAKDATERALAVIRQLSWPRHPAATEAIVPILIGGPLPWMVRKGGG